MFIVKILIGLIIIAAIISVFLGILYLFGKVSRLIFPENFYLKSDYIILDGLMLIFIVCIIILLVVIFHMIGNIII